VIPLGPEGFAELTSVSRETLARFEAYAELLKRWSGRINLVSGNALHDPWRRHFLDSAQLLPFLPSNAQSLVDLGSGAGFPGLVLAILGVPGVALVEADARKCAFLREAARIAAAPITIHNTRAEAMTPCPADVVTARGCAPLDRLLVLSQWFIGPKTVCLFLKGAGVAEELTAARRAWTMTVSLHPSWSDPRGAILSLEQIAPRRDGWTGGAEVGRA
jgi:16S rRNA (guanine527-N7)-methyltransferase